MPKLKDIAAVTMDMYHRTYTKDDEFFDLQHFQFLVASAYSALVQQDYENAKAENRGIFGFSFVGLPPGLTKEVTIPVSKKNGCNYYEGELPCDIKVFNFTFDTLDSGIQLAMDADGMCNASFVKIAAKDLWRISSMPVHGEIMHYRIGNKKRFLNVKCNLENVTLQYLPDITSEDEDAEIPYKMLAVANVALQIMTAPGEKIIDKTNNSNENSVAQTELDKRTV